MNFPSFVVRFQRTSLLLGLATALTTSLFAVEPVRVVATGGRMANGSITVSDATTAFRQRTPHKLGGPVAEIQLGFMNWAHGGTTAEVANINAITLDYVWIERASTSQIIAVRFSGQRQLVMPAASTAPYHLADPIPSSQWTGAAPARDEVFWVHIRGSIPTDGKIMLGTPIGYTGSKFVVFNPANDPGTYDTSGVVPSISGASTRSTGLPLLFLGRYTGPGHLAVIGLGDSIMDGYGDSKNPVIAGNGPLSRAAVDANGANTIATLNLTRSGETAKTWVNHHLRQAQILPFANVVVEEFATNDIGANNPDADANLIIARLESIWTTARDAGVQKIVRTRLLPRTISASSNWLSKADQTPNLNWGPGGIRDTVNAHFQTALTQGKIDAIADMLTPVADPTDNRYWLTNGTNDYMTSDGCHPRPAAHALMAVPLRAALLSLTVDDTTPPTLTEIIIDNLADAPLFTKSAGWFTGTAAGKYGSNYFHDGDTRDGSKYAFFSPDFTSTGTYAVFVNWAPHDNRASNTPIEVIHAGGTTPFEVSQKTGGDWHPLGEFTFGPNGAQGVYIDNHETDGHVIVDAVKFTPVAPSGGGTPGADIIFQSWTSSPWNAANQGTSFSASATSDGVTGTFTFANPKTGVGVTNQSAPNNSSAVSSFFGHEPTGFGVGNSTVGRFDTGEQFTLQATRNFVLDTIHLNECDTDEVLHLKWTQNGQPKEKTFPITSSTFTFANVRPDADTLVTITNVSQGAALNGRLRINRLTVAYLLD